MDKEFSRKRRLASVGRAPSLTKSTLTRGTPPPGKGQSFTQHKRVREDANPTEGRFSTEMNKEKSAGAIIFRNETPRKYLLLHYTDGHWDFVKGNVEEGETEKQTVIREAEEETGITDLTFLNFNENIDYIYTREGKKIAKEVVFFLASTETKDITLSHEHHDYTWLPYENALKKTTFKNAQEILEKAEKFLKEK